MKYCFLLLACFLLSLSAVAQVFKGRVTDIKGNSVPYASLYLSELQSGFTTDDNGCFQTTLKAGSYTCEVSSLGFTGQTLQLQIPAAGLTRNIVLAERVYELREVNITNGGEDPAYAVMRRAIAKAPYYREWVKSYTAGVYLKGTGKIKDIPAILKLSKEVRKDSKKLLDKLFLMEDQREVKFTAPATWSNRVIAYSSSFPDNITVDMDMMNVNFYTPTIFGMVSPLSPGAFSYYRFRLDGCFVEGNRVVNKIKLLPKKEHPKLLKGYIYVVEDLWCISAADLSFSMSGIQAATKVTCKEVKPSAFLPTSISMECKIELMGVKAEASYLTAIHYAKVELSTQLPGARPEQKAVATTARPLSKRQQKTAKQIEKLSAKDDLTIGEAYQLSKLVSRTIEEADTLRSAHKFERRARGSNLSVERDSLAGKKDSVYWATVRSVPLRTEELESYMRKEKQSLSKDSLRKMSGASGTGGNSISVGSDKGAFSTFLFGHTFRTKDKKAWLRLYGLQGYTPEYNFVDGLWVGAKFSAGVKLSDAASLRFTPLAYYTTARKSVVGSGELVLDYAPRRMGKLWLNGGVLSIDYNGEGGELRLINSVSSLLFARNDLKLYDKRFLSIGNNVELTNGMLFSAGLTWQQRKMLENNASYSIFRARAGGNIPRSNAFRTMPENELLKASFALEYTPAHYYRMSHGKKVYEESRFPTFTLAYERAFPLAGQTPSPSYHRAEVSIRQQVAFGMFNRLSWSANAGTFWGAKQMQFPDYKHFSATRLPVTERAFDDGFFVLDNYAYSTANRWVQAGLTWHTPYLLLKQLAFLKKKRWDEALHLRSLVVYGRTPYTEVGYSIGFAHFARLGVFAGFNGVKFHAVGASVSLPLSTFRGD